MVTEYLFRTEVWVPLATMLLLYLAFWYLSSRNEPPGPWGLPIVGYLPFLGRKMNLTVTELGKKYGDVFQLKLGSRKVLVVSGHRAIKQALINQGHTFSGRPDFYTYTTMGGFGFADYTPRVRVCKKYTMKAIGEFSMVRRKELQTIGHSGVEMICRKLGEADNQPFDPKNTIEKATCTIMGYICYGKFFDIDDKEVVTILDCSRNFAEVVAFGVIVDFFPWAKCLMRKKLCVLEQLMNALKTHSDRLAEAHIESYDGDTIRDMSDMFRKLAENMNTEERRALKVDDEMLKDHVANLFGAGFSTITSTIRYSLMLMALHRDVQTRVQDEIDRVIGRERLPLFQDESRMSYTAATLTEVYRYHSMSAFAATHATTQDTEFEGYAIKRGTPVIINLYSAHRDDKIFTDPDSFNPERFLDSERGMNKSLAKCVMPYGVGRRRCAGEPIARLEVFLIFATILQKCIVEQSMEFPIDLNNYIMGMGIMHGACKMVFRSRNGEW